MLDENRNIFDAFKKLHNDYSLSQNTLQEKFNEEGKKILEIINDYENRLCKRSEGSGYGAYSSNLAEKFRSEVKRLFPLVDNIGIVVFKIKKIKLT